MANLYQRCSWQSADSTQLPEKPCQPNAPPLSSVIVTLLEFEIRAQYSLQNKKATVLLDLAFCFFHFLYLSSCELFVWLCLYKHTRLKNDNQREIFAKFFNEIRATHTSSVACNQGIIRFGAMNLVWTVLAISKKLKQHSEVFPTTWSTGFLFVNGVSRLAIKKLSNTCMIEKTNRKSLGTAKPRKPSFEQITRTRGVHRVIVYKVHCRIHTVNFTPCTMSTPFARLFN